MLTALAQAPAAIVTRRPFKTLADLKGMKIRVPGSALLIEQLKQLGAAPIAMSLGEVLPAFQNGTIDGVLCGDHDLHGAEVLRHLEEHDAAAADLPGHAGHRQLAASCRRLGPLANTVLDAARQVDTDSQAWGAQDVANAEKLWQTNGGEVFTLNDADVKQYLDVVVPVAVKSLTPAARKDYDVLKAAAKVGL